MIDGQDRCSKGRDELLRSTRRRLRIAYLGMDSTWLRWVERIAHGLRSFSITMRAVGREYWAVVQRLVPDARTLIGPLASDLLDSGVKLEVDGFVARHRAAFFRELRRRMRTALRRR